MFKSFCVVLVTNDISSQVDFYVNTLSLNKIFDYGDTIGLGKDSAVWIVLRKEDNPNSHHLQENKGPIIITFRTDIAKKEIILNKVKKGGYKIRSMLDLKEFGSEYYFIEDADGNEVCLDFILKSH